jgi:hypothetical protein
MATARGGKRDGFADVLWYAGLALYLVAFALPYDEEGAFGFQVFYIGLLYCWLPMAGLPFWWANPLLWYAAATFTRSPGRAAVAACVAAVLGLGWAVVHYVPGPAYWCWVAGMGVLAVGAVARAVRRTAPAPTRPSDDRDDW